MQFSAALITILLGASSASATAIQQRDCFSDCWDGCGAIGVGPGAEIAKILCQAGCDPNCDANKKAKQRRDVGVEPRDCYSDCEDGCKAIGIGPGAELAKGMCLLGCDPNC